MNDMSAIAPIAAEQLWVRMPDGPWAKTTAPVRILDVRDGWVRYYMNTFWPDERMLETHFRRLYEPFTDGGAQ